MYRLCNKRGPESAPANFLRRSLRGESVPPHHERYGGRQDVSAAGMESHQGSISPEVSHGNQPAISSRQFLWTSCACGKGTSLVGGVIFFLNFKCPVHRGVQESA